ncbi:hypothetical protein [Enterovibrio sp. 27052020O]|uniref:nucleotide-binding protein n=1 Tax=Enterovibrio sp. 27052020O TaxID=3241166 RepID=UPI00388D67D3
MSIITFSGTKGGTGKSSGAINLAYYCQVIRQLKTVVVDADGQGSTRKLLRNKREGLTDIICFAVQGNCRSDIKRLAESHDVVIVDTGGHASDTLNFVLSVADLCAMPFSIGALDTAEAETMKGVIDFVSEFNPGIKPISYLNRVPVLPSMVGYANNAADRLSSSFPVAPCRLATREKPYSELANGRTLYEQSDQSAIKAQEEFTNLAQHLLNEVGL